ncbi:hsp90 co-chaperone Cdc37 [Mycoemilia scoparia]|uniref:Hsp90 chaperone protein kinase-targeting subunit n=1 Tax=Mycoemilia scoparia TaxID=417184 RepID=A0A9W7ZVU2_9FUNG|nr:hsp90 co-chaperone Cdc37 [Mycoemilia scoparia]
MPIDYSKWDNLELSDDSEVEIHPNIEKGTFLRLRQQKIRREREERRQKREQLTLKIDLHKKIREKLGGLKSELGESDIEKFASAMNSWKAKMDNSQAVQDKLNKLSLGGNDGNEANQTPGVDHQENQDASALPTFDDMIASLFQQIRAEIEKEGVVWDTSDKKVHGKFFEGLESHIKRMGDVISQAQKDLDEVLKEEAKHISVDELVHEGFNHTIISNKSTNKEGQSVEKSKTHSVELLNPQRPVHGDEKQGEVDSTKAQPTEQTPYSDYNQDDYEYPELAKDSQKFAELKTMEATKDYMRDHPSIVSEQKSDQILAAAFDLQLKGKTKKAKQYVRQSLIISYVHAMGPGGPRLFFERVAVEGSKAHNMFTKDVEDRYKHIVTRCEYLAKENENDQDAEVIQLEGSHPSEYQGWNIPDENNPDSSEDFAERLAKFKALPEDLQKALQVGTLDAVNKVLAEMSPTDAEKVLNECSDAGFLTAAWIPENEGDNNEASAATSGDVADDEGDGDDAKIDAVHPDQTREDKA